MQVLFVECYKVSGTLVLAVNTHFKLPKYLCYFFILIFLEGYVSFNGHSFLFGT